MSEIVTMRELLESGVHFGHQTKRWNPKMKRYIFTSRNGIHVIDLQQSIKLIKVAYDVIKELASQKGLILFVGTKKQAQEAIHDEANRCGMPFIHNRWLGGTLTNAVTIRKSVNKLKKLGEQEEDGTFASLSNKEASRKTKALNKLKHNLAGIQNMITQPAALFILDTKREQLAVQEARKLNIPIIGVVDTNADPTEVDYPIPANDDAIRAIRLICSIMANAIIEGRDGEATESTKEHAQTEGKKETATKPESDSTDEGKKETVSKEETSEKVASPKDQATKNETVELLMDDKGKN